jgi:trigger factor
LRLEVQEQLERQSQETYNQMYDEQVLDEAIAQASIKYPPQMLEREIDSLLHNLEHRLEAQNLDLEAYLKNREMDMEALREEARETAETRLKRNLFLYELAQAEQVEVEPEQLQQETVRTMNSLASSLSEKEVKRLSNREIVNNIINTVAADLLVDKATERMRKIASGEVEAQGAQTQTAEVAEPEGMEELEIEMDLGTPPAEEPETIQPEAEMEPEPEVENAPQAEESQEDEEAASEEKEKENEE